MKRKSRNAKREIKRKYAGVKGLYHYLHRKNREGKEAKNR